MQSLTTDIPSLDTTVRLKVAATLRDGERIVSSFGPYFATSRRILLYLEQAKGLLVRELPYEEFDDIRAVNESNHKLLGLGALLVIASIASMLFLGLFLPLAGVGLGGYVLLIGAMGRPAYYQIEAEEIDSDDLWLWRINHRGGGSFIATIRVIMGKDPQGHPS